MNTGFQPKGWPPNRARIEPLREHLKIEQRENDLVRGAFHSRTDGRNIEHRSIWSVPFHQSYMFADLLSEGQVHPSPILHYPSQL